MEIESPARILAVDDCAVRTVLTPDSNSLAAEIEVFIPDAGIRAISNLNDIIPTRYCSVYPLLYRLLRAMDPVPYRYQTIMRIAAGGIVHIISLFHIVRVNRISLTVHLFIVGQAIIISIGLMIVMLMSSLGYRLVRDVSTPVAVTCSVKARRGLKK